MAAYRLGGILDSVAKEKGCVAKPATELGLHGKHNAEGNLVRGMALVVFQMVALIAEGTSRAGASEVELAEGAARSVSPCWAQALITVLRPAVGEARSPRSQTF